MRPGLLVLVLGCTPPASPPVDWSATSTGEPAPAWHPGTRDTGTAWEVPSLPPWIEWPIVWNADRAKLTVAYLAQHRGPHAVTGDDEADTRMVPRAIILHWTGGPTAASAWHTFEAARARGRFSADHQRLNLSAHFVVDRDGTTFRLLDETRVGRHAIGMNHLAIGIENVGDGARMPLTPAQVAANAALVRLLVQRHPTITHLIGHYETRLMEAHPYFEETNPKHRSRRLDPGPEFMRDVRAAVADLNLEGPSLFTEPE